MVRIFKETRNDKTENQREEEIEQIEREIQQRGDKRGRQIEEREGLTIEPPMPQRSPQVPRQLPIVPQQERVKYIERAVTLELVNDKLNYLIKLLEEAIEQQ